MTKRTTLGRSSLGWTAVAALGVILVGLTVICNYALRGWQLDLTQNHLYTISRGTRRILAGIREPIDLDFFYSSRAAQDLPQLRAYADHVEDFLEEIAQSAHGKIRLHVIDPQPYSVAEDGCSSNGPSSCRRPAPPSPPCSSRRNKDRSARGCSSGSAWCRGRECTGGSG